MGMEKLMGYQKMIFLIILPILFYAKTVRYEGEHLYARSFCNNVIEDITASNDSCRAAFVKHDSRGHLIYGPKVTFPPGLYVATFRLKTGNDGISINPIGIIDITSRREYPLKYHAYQPIFASSFDSIYNWQDTRVGFYLKDTIEYFQLRIEWFDSVDLYVDYVDVKSYPHRENITFAINLQDIDLDMVPDLFDEIMTDRRILLASIQAGVNRDKANLVLLHDYRDYEGQGIYRWLYALDIPYVLLTYDECVEKLVIPNTFNGCVFFDPGELSIDAINNPPEYQKLLFQVKAIATNLAALDSLLIVTPRTINDIDLTKFPIKYDLTDRDIYPFLKDLSGDEAMAFNIQLFETYKFNKDVLFKLFPYMSSSPLRNASEKLTDYAIQNRCWSFYKDLRNDTDNSFFENEVFNQSHFLMGWPDEGWANESTHYCKEYEHIKLASEAGKLWIGDMNRIHNLSFFARLPNDIHYIYRQSAPQIPKLEHKTYISFITMDGDNPLLWLKHYRRDWDSPLRGKIPVSWGIPPKLLDLAPAVLQYLYRTKTQNDYFIADISGLAWHLTDHFDFNDFPEMLIVTADYFEKLDIRVVKLMADRNDDIVDLIYLNKFVDTYPAIKGFVEGYWPPAEQGFIIARERYPSIRLAINEPRSDGGVLKAVDVITSVIDATSNRYLFLPIIYNIYSDSYRTRTQTLFDKLDSIRTFLSDKYSDIEYVRLDVMMELIKEHYETSNK